MPVAATSGSGSVVALIPESDIETALLMVQGERTRLLDTQLTMQIKQVQSKNDQAQKLNAALAALNAVLAQYPKDGDSDATIKDWNQDKVDRFEKPLNQALQDAGITQFDQWPSGTGQLPDGSRITGSAVFNGDRTLGEVKAAQTILQSQVDSLNSTQQMDMLRLQSLSNKRNEAFDVMTNFIKKMQDSRSSIIGNMR